MIQVLLYRFHTAVVLMIACLSWVPLYSQDLKADYAAVYNQISKSVTITYDFKVSVYASREQVIKKDNIHFEKSASGMYYSTNEMEFFLDKNISVMVYKKAAKVLWSRIDPAEYEQISAPSTLLASDSLFKKVDSIKYEGIVNNDKIYHVYYSNQSIDHMSMAFDSKTNMIRNIVYFYSKAAAGSVYCSRIDVVHISCSKDEKKISREAADFVAADGKGMKPALAYQGYSISEISEKLYIK